MPVSFKKPNKAVPEFIHVDDDIPENELTGARLNLDPRVKAFEIHLLPIESLQPNPKNARRHPERQLSSLAANIERFGFWVPILVDEDNVIQAGHARWLVAQRLGFRHLPVIRQSELTPAAKRAFAIADNRISELAEWDYDILGEAFEFFGAADEVEFDLSVTGFDTAEIDQLLDPQARQDKSDPADEVSLPDPEAIPVTRLGDVWLCGAHVLLCGDARDPAQYASLMGSERAQVVFADPPYNVPNAGHVTKREGVREFDMARGEMSGEQFTGFLEIIAKNMLHQMDQGAVAYLCMDWRHMMEMRTAGDRVFGPLKNLIVWVKPNAGMGSFYRSQHELIFAYRAPGKPVNNFGLGGAGRHRTNVWTYRGLTSFGRDRDETLAMHPTVKPVAMVKDALKDCSHRGDVVLDPFGGSGTTMIAAEATKRKARLIEIDALYCDTIVERWQKFTGQTARLGGTGESFADVRTSRANGQNMT